MDYNPENQEDDSYAGETEFESIENDTGIRVAQRREEGFSFDYADESVSELNFDY